MTKRLMDLKNDFAFKRIFGIPKNKHFLLSFLNDLLKSDFTDIDIINSEVTPESFDGKKALLDLHAVTSDGVRINIEIQVKDKFDMVNRSLFYWSKVFQEQLKKKDNYSSLTKTIAINLLDYNLLENAINDNYHSTFHLYEDSLNYQLTDILEIHFVEFKKWENNVDKDNLYDVAKRDKINVWMAMFNAVRSNKINQDMINFLEEFSGGEPIMKDVMSEWERVSDDDKNWSEYLTREKIINDENVGFGDVEKRKALKIALKMLQNGENDEKIIEYTEITPNELKSLKRLLK